MEIKLIKDMYELSNGSMVRGKVDAEREQKRINFKLALTECVSNHVDLVDGQDSVIDFITSNTRLLKTLLKILD